MIFAEDLQLGQSYKVGLEDCCIRGEFTALLTERRYSEGGSLDVLVFNNGVRLSEWDQVRFEEAGS